MLEKPSPHVSRPEARHRIRDLVSGGGIDDGPLTRDIDCSDVECEFDVLFAAAKKK